MAEVKLKVSERKQVDGLITQENHLRATIEHLSLSAGKIHDEAWKVLNKINPNLSSYDANTGIGKLKE